MLLSLLLKLRSTSSSYKATNTTATETRWKRNDEQWSVVLSCQSASSSWSSTTSISFHTRIPMCNGATKWLALYLEANSCAALVRFFLGLLITIYISQKDDCNHDNDNMYIYQKAKNKNSTSISTKAVFLSSSCWWLKWMVVNESLSLCINFIPTWKKQYVWLLLNNVTFRKKCLSFFAFLLSL